MQRLFVAIRQPGYSFQNVIPLMVASILFDMKDNTYESAILAWWSYNGNTVFFANRESTKRVRALVKNPGGRI